MMMAHSQEKRLLRRWLVVSYVCLVPLSVALAEESQGDSIDFNGRRLTLGMSQDQVLRLVAERYGVEQKGQGLWWVYDKTGSGTNGVLCFSGGKLVQARRYWELVESAAGPAVNTLRTAFAAIHQMVPGAFRSCKVYPDRGPEMIGVTITCGTMLVQVHIDREESGTDRVFVDQVLGTQLYETSGCQLKR